MCSSGVEVEALSTSQLVATFASVAAELARREVAGSAVVCLEEAEALIRAADVLERAVAHRVAVVDAAGEMRRWGYPSTRSWLRSRLGMREARAKERLLLARHLPRLPAVAERLTTGTLSLGHTAAVAES